MSKYIDDIDENDDDDEETGLTDEDIEDAVSGWDIPAGIHAHVYAERANNPARVAIIREARWINEDGDLKISDRTHEPDPDAYDSTIEAWLDEDYGDGSTHAGDLLRVAAPETMEDLEELGRWVEALESSDARSDRAALERVTDALEGECPEDYADAEEPEAYGYREPDVWVKGGELHAAVLSRSSKGGAVEAVRHADGTIERLS